MALSTSQTRCLRSTCVRQVAAAPRAAVVTRAGGNIWTPNGSADRCALALSCPRRCATWHWHAHIRPTHHMWAQRRARTALPSTKQIIAK